MGLETQETTKVVKNRRRRSLVVGIALVAAAICLAVYINDRLHIPDVPAMTQFWASSGVEPANTDSVAALLDSQGQPCVFATSKWGDRIDEFDGDTGAFIRSIGHSGESPGEFRRPNGIAVVRFNASAQKRQTDAADESRVRKAIVVVERDGARAQVFDADDCRPIGIIGEKILRRPYGAAVSYREQDPLLYVTDSDVTPDKTVSVFRLKWTQKGVKAQLVQQFGDLDEGRIYKTESIVVDDELGRILLCDEARSQHNVKVYDIDGKFTGRTFGDGLIVGDPEGIVIVDTPGGGAVLVTDQRSRITIWHAFDRKTLDFIASFSGEPRIANTDGICLLAEPFKGHPAGAMFAVNDDADVRAYDLATIIKFVDQARRSAPRP